MSEEVSHSLIPISHLRLAIVKLVSALILSLPFTPKDAVYLLSPGYGMYFFLSGH